jgi:hypothetical protein
MLVATAEAAPSIQGMQLVASTRISRNVYEYTYRLHIKNTTPAYTNAVLTAASSAADTTIIKVAVSLGDVAENSDFVTTDLFKFRQDRTYPYAPSKVLWSFTGDPVQPQPFVGFSMVEERGRPLHEGWMPLRSSPIPGVAPAHALAQLQGPPTTASFWLVDESSGTETSI